MNVIFDEKRSGYFIGDKKDKFQVFAYFTCDPSIDFDEKNLEFHVESMFGVEVNHSFQIPIGKAEFPSCDLVETLVMREIWNWINRPQNSRLST